VHSTPLVSPSVEVDYRASSQATKLAFIFIMDECFILSLNFYGYFFLINLIKLSFMKHNLIKYDI
jgi:hypothetical protein